MVGGRVTNYSTLYAHLKSFNVKEGDRINAGDVIGFVGSTGFSTRPQLHYEVRLNNKQLNPKNFLE